MNSEQIKNQIKEAKDFLKTAPSFLSLSLNEIKKTIKRLEKELSDKSIIEFADMNNQFKT